MKPLAKRSYAIKGQSAFAIWERAMALEAQGKQIIHLELGEPDLDTPGHIVDASIEAVRNGRTRYIGNAGIPALRKAIAAYVTRTRGVPVDPAHVVTTMGVKGTLFLSLISLIDDGDEILVPDPGYFSYREIPILAGGTPVLYSLRAENGFEPDIAELEAAVTPRTKCLILNSPNNPFGNIYSAATLEEIADFVLRHDLWLLSDEIYYQLYYTPQPPPSIFSLPEMAERMVLMDGFSKAYAMTGWRLGFGIFPEPLIKPVTNLALNSYACLIPFIQDAAVVALEGSQEGVIAMRNMYSRRRDMALRVLDRIPNISYTHPDGAFYIMIDVSKIGDGDSKALANRILDAGVALLPGDGFGDGGKGYLRLAFTQPEAQIEEAMVRIERVLRGTNC